MFIAGLLARAVGAGVAVTLICATRGERGWIAGKRVAAAEVTRIRTLELDESCRRIGIGPPLHLDLPDAGLSESSAEHTRAITGALDASGADAVVSYGHDGGYGHRDHLAVAAIVAGTRPTIWLRVAFPAGLFAPLTEQLQRFEPALLGDAHEPAPVSARWLLELDDDEVAVKRAAAAAHASQLDARGVFLFDALETEIFSREIYHQ